MKNLSEYAKDLLEKAGKASSTGPLLPDNFGRCWDAYAELHGACSPDSITALAKAFLEQQEALRSAQTSLREAEGLLSVFGELGNRPAKNWLAKFAKGEKG